MRRPLAASLALGTTLAATLGHAALAQGEPADPDHPVWKIVQPNESVGGQTYEAWARDYTEWLLWDRTPENPPPDATGDCEGGQPGGDVFFVPHTMIGTASEYACSVGADQHLMVFLGGWIDWADDGQASEQLLDEFYDPHYQFHGFEFTLDGVTVPVGSHLTLQPDLYSVDFDEDNLFGLSAGPRDVLLAGLTAVMLEPLEPGEHELTVKNTNFDPGLVDGDEQFADAVSILTLTVE
jgi:hypothetical protein